MTKKELKEYLELDRKMYISGDFKTRIFRKFSRHTNYLILDALKCFRKFYYYKEKNNFLMTILYGRKKNKYIRNHQLELAGKLGKNIRISHLGIVINENAVVGDNVIFHGMNCIGNNGKSKAAPVIGNNVDIGFGSIIIGDIKIADGIKIGANSVVNKSFTEENITIAGSPARIIKK